jgi:prepilin peptidase CpaA
MVINVLLLTVLAVCVVTDLRSRKIYNHVIFPALMAAFVLHAAHGGWAGIGFAAAGFAVGLGVLLIPYLLGGMGAGDVKLLALIGACKGTSFVLTASLSMMLCGGLIALVLIVIHKEAWAWARYLIMAFYSFRYGVRLTLKGKMDALTTTYPYGIAIAAGTFVCFWSTNEWGNVTWLVM